MNPKNILLLLLVATVGLVGVLGQRNAAPPETAGIAVLEQAVAQPSAESAVDRAFAERASGDQVTGTGVVVKVLSDDNEGSRHQRFILRLKSGLTLLVAHNIDLAQRLEGLQVSDTVEFNGEYEWNEKGGVVHWTHRDPGGRHAAGWLKYNGRAYQ